MNEQYKLIEIGGISNFMLFLMDNLSETEFDKILELHMDYVEQLIKS